MDREELEGIVREVLEVVEKAVQMAPVIEDGLDKLNDIHASGSISSLLKKAVDIIRPIGGLVMNAAWWVVDTRAKSYLRMYNILDDGGMPEDAILICLKNHTVEQENLMLRVLNTLNGIMDRAKG